MELNVLLSNSERGRTAAKTAVVLGVCAVVIPASFASVYGLAPFALAFALAIAYCGYPVLSAVAFALSGALFNASLTQLLSAVAAGAVIVTLRIFGFKNAKKKVVYFIPVASAAMLSQMFLLSFEQKTVQQIFLYFFLCSVFTYLAAVFLSPVIVHRLKYKLLSYQLAAGGCCLAVVSLGFSLIPAKIPLISLVGAFITLFLSAVSSAYGITAALCVGIGVSLNGGGVGNVALWALYAVIVNIFTSAPKAVRGFSGIVAYALYAFYFNTYAELGAYLFFFGLALAAALFCAVPNSVVERLEAYLMPQHLRPCVRHIINRNRAETGAKLLSAADAFCKMQEILGGMDGDVMIGSESILKQTRESLCFGCSKNNECKSKDMDTALVSLCACSAQKDRITVVDIPQAVIENCKQVPKLITVIGDSAEKFKKLLKARQNENASRHIIAHQMGGVADVLGAMAKDAKTKLAFNQQKEREIIQELSYGGVIALEIMISAEEPIFASAVVRSDTLVPALIQKVFSRALRVNMRITAVEAMAMAGFSTLSIEQAPRFDAVFATASSAKGQASGDTHTFIKLSESKFLMALCDGMGHGSAAHAISANAIGLLESFYKAGFSSTLVLSQANRFLQLGGGESYAALDIAVIDLNSGETDIIKIGSPQSLIKYASTTEIIDGGALPIGVLDEIRPLVTTRKLCNKDMLVFATDGITECYSDEEFATMVNNIRVANPQTLASEILQNAVGRVGKKIKDDMSVSVLRLFVR